MVKWGYVAFAQKLYQVTVFTSNDTHDQWMRNSRFDVQRLLVQCFQFFVVLLYGVHLNFQCIDFQQLCAFLQIILSVIGLRWIIHEEKKSESRLTMQKRASFHSPLRLTWHDWCNCFNIFCNLPKSLRSKYSLPNLVFVLNHRRSFLASFSASNVVS